MYKPNFSDENFEMSLHLNDDKLYISIKEIDIDINDSYYGSITLEKEDIEILKNYLQQQLDILNN